MLTIVIVNWKTCEHLRRCLSSLKTHGLGEEMQVVVVDNASGDGSVEMVRDEFPSVRLIALDRNVGYAEGNNRGFEAATGEFVLTLNPDVEFFDDSLRIAVDEMRRCADVGAMGIRLVDPDGATTQASLRSFPRPRAIVPEMLGLAKLLPGVFGQYRMRVFDYGKSQEVEQPMGTFVLYRRAVLDKVGVMDEQFPIFFNEVDLLQRIANAGWKIWYCAEARLKHHGGASTRQVRKPMIWESHRSLVRYYRKWYYRWWNAPLFWLFAGLVYLGAFVRARGLHAGFRP
ncbi:MAG: glycosyltransferase family 2 protein [Armatimonadota bacterium]|nr:glycosyltransferase family 2 protein [Armatimonadota bacterium]